MNRRVIGVSLGIWLLLSLSLWVSGWDPAIVVLGGIFVAGAVTIFVAVDLVTSVHRAGWPDQRDRVELGGRHHERVQVLAGDLYRSEWTDTTEIRETLLGVMDERLLAEYGIERRAQREAADQLLPPRLRRLAAGPSQRLANVSELRSILTDIEEL